MQPRPLILASRSPYRRELLERLGLAFRQAGAGIDESPAADEAPEALVARLAVDKAQAVATEYPGALVIGADQLAVLAGRILGKPGTEAAAREQLAACSGREVRFLTAVHLLDTETGPVGSHTDETVVVFRELATEEIRDYVAQERPLDCAGSFKAEGLGISLFAAIRTEDPTAIVGLPMIALCGLLRAGGLQVPPPVTAGTTGADRA